MLGWSAPAFRADRKSPFPTRPQVRAARDATGAAGRQPGGPAAVRHAAGGGDSKPAHGGGGEDHLRHRLLAHLQVWPALLVGSSEAVLHALSSAVIRLPSG